MKALILMTRVPVPGRTKTRLQEVLTSEECAEIHSCFLKDIFAELGRLDESIDVFITYTPEGEFSLLEEMVPESFRRFPQEGETLGERMMNAFKTVMESGYSDVVLIGSDLPELQKCDIEEAFSVLEREDICIGPTLDGGYYLIGMKELQHRLFTEDIKWGNKTVLEGTFRLIDYLELSVGMAKKQRDIDTTEDLDYLIDKRDKLEQRENSPVNTINFIRDYLERRMSDEGWARTQD